MSMKIYPDIKTPKLTDQILFEIKSFIGRKIFKKRSLIRGDSQPLLLDIGAGSNYKEGWVHIDFFRIALLRFWRNYYRKKEIDVEADLRYPLNCSCDVVDGVYSGHTLEHLYPREAYQLLCEIYRVLKSKAWLRINVPDLTRMINYYIDKIDIPEYKYKAEGIANLTQNYGHHSVWDEELLAAALKSVGFINVKKVVFGKEATDKRLIKEEEVRRTETLVMEAQKP